MGILDLFGLRRSPRTPNPPDTGVLPGLDVVGGREQGYRSTPENAIRNLYRQFWVDPELRQSILDIRTMDRLDGRVKRIHRQTSRAAAKGGLILRVKDGPKWLQDEWKRFQVATGLDGKQKLQSDLRGLMMEGNLPLQWVLNDEDRIAGCVRMPADTIVPKVGANGRFEDPRRAYEQIDLSGVGGGTPVLATFALWQLTLCRLDPDNYDDWGSLGRPYLDASRPVWKKLKMTEEDLVIRRRTRAPQRNFHSLEGASAEELAEYQARVESDIAQGNWKDYYANKKGAVQPLAGDSNLDQIGDVAYLLDTFFAGAPAPKGLFGLGAAELQRDILEDLKKDFFDEIDALQDTCSEGYETGFRLHLLLAGRNPAAWDFEVQFLERRTDTPNQRADLALKYQALGMSRETVIEATGIDGGTEAARAERQAKNRNPYPADGLETPPLPGEVPRVARVSVTPGNARKGESAVDVATRRPMP